MSAPIKMSRKELAEWNDEMVRKYHSEGIIYESKNPLLRFIENHRLKVMLKLARVSRNDVVLDVGCGEGYLISMIPRTVKVVGLDISKVALEKAEELLRNKDNVKLVFGDAQKMRFKKDSFDKVLCSELIEHVPEPRDVIKSVYKVLKPKGIFVISIPDEKKVRKIVKMLKMIGIYKFLHGMRKKEDYDWHLHEPNIGFLNSTIKGYFKKIKVVKIPPIIGYRYVVSLKKIRRSV